LAYNLTNEEDLVFEGNDEGTFDSQDLIERLIRLMFAGDPLTKKVCVEGFTRLLFNKRIKNPTEILTLLQIIWHDTLVVRDGGHEIIQILSMFFRTFTSYSVQGLGEFEKSLENFLTLLVTLAESKESEFNHELINYELNDDFIVGTVGSIGISILNTLPREEDKNLDDKFTPAERFFLFLCEESSSEGKNSKFFRKILERMIANFNIENLTPMKQNVLYRFFAHFVNQLPETGRENFEGFLKKLKDEEILTNESALEKINSILEEDRKTLRSEFRTFLKSIKDWNILTNRRTIIRPAELKEDEEGEEKEADEQEDTGSKSKSKRGRKKKETSQKSKKPAIEEEDDEEDVEEEEVHEEEEEEEPEEEETSRTRPTRAARGRGRPPKESPKPKQVEESEDEEENDEEENEEEENEEEEEVEEEEEPEEEETSRTKATRGRGRPSKQSPAKPASKGKGKKAVPKEESEEEPEEEEEEPEEEPEEEETSRTRATRGKGGRKGKQPAAPQAKASKTKGKGKQIEEEEPEEEEAKPTRGRGRKRKEPQPSKEVDEEEEKAKPELKKVKKGGRRSK
jgi:hypothetical protein